jgi:hypothetical protein
LSLALRKENRVGIFENRMLRRILQSKRENVTDGWRKLHNKELPNLYSSPSIIRILMLRRMKWEGHIAHMAAQKCVDNFGEIT